MAHVRTQIRDTVAALLTSYIYDRLGIVLLDRTGGKVELNDGLLPSGSIYKMRRYALDDSKLPAICVYTTDETSSLATIGNRTLRRVINVMVEIYAKGASGTISDTVDNLCVAAEEAIAGNFSLNGLVKSCILTSTETDINVEGESSIGSARLVYAVEYVTSISAVETAR